MPDNLRIAVDELRKRMENGEDFTIIDTRNPQAWSQSDDCRSQFVSPWTRSTRTFPKFQRTNRLLPTVPDRTKVPAPVWRKNFGTVDTRMSGRFRAGSMPGGMRVCR